MPLAPGTRLGPYEVLGPLGAGGMGEVYRARDTRLDRSVAIKVLPAHLAASPELRARLEREARSVSALNHPHICTLFDVGHQDGVDFIVMELVEGETLSSRVARGPLPTPEVLRYGIELAEALDRAHRAGIVHRDLKPGNVMLTKSGVKLMDFGLARGGGGASSPSALTPAPADRSQSPTLAQPLTAEGTIVGTFQYMAPEQLEGREADARTDLWALGAVLHEMATGKKAFEGRSQASLISAIMSSDPPPISSVSPMSPPALDRVVRACLAKDPEDRISTAHDVKLQLEWIRDAGSQAGVPAPLAERRRRTARTAWSVALLGVIAALAAWLPRLLGPKAPDFGVVRFQIPSTAHYTLSQDPMEIRVSPDGRQVVSVAADSSGRPRLWVRSIAAIKGRFLEGTDGATEPFWSPDSRWIGFFANGKLRKLEAAGGTPEVVCDAPDPRGATWSPSGIIVFAPTAAGGLVSVPDDGGTPTPVASPDTARHETALRWPEFLPDGKHLICVVLPTRDGLFDSYVMTLGSSKRTPLVSSDAAPVPAGNGWIIYARNDRMVAQRLDPTTFVTRGPAIPLGHTPDLSSNAIGARCASASTNGVLVHTPNEGTTTDLLWMDRQGRPISAVPAPPGYYVQAAISRDGRSAMLVKANSSSSSDLWIMDLATYQMSRFTFTPASRMFGVVWSPDSKRVAYNSNVSGPIDIYLKSVDGAGDEEPVLRSKVPFKNLDDWSPDGRELLFEQPSPNTGWDIWRLPVDGDRKPVPVLKSPFNESAATLSPDGKWITYVSDETGRPETYAQSYPTTGHKVQLTTNGGQFGLWSPDDREIFVLGPDAVLYSIPVRTQPTFHADRPVPLFKLDPASIYAYPTPDGKRFLAIRRSEGVGTAELVVEMNWPAAIEKK